VGRVCVRPRQVEAEWGPCCWAAGWCREEAEEERAGAGKAVRGAGGGGEPRMGHTAELWVWSPGARATSGHVVLSYKRWAHRRGTPALLHPSAALLCLFALPRPLQSCPSPPDALIARGMQKNRPLITVFAVTALGFAACDKAREEEPSRAPPEGTYTVGPRVESVSRGFEGRYFVSVQETNVASAEDGTLCARRAGNRQRLHTPRSGAFACSACSLIVRRRGGPH
jgi:hypothetical protein